MKILYIKSFIKDAKELSKNDALKLTEMLELLSRNPYDKRLHSKKLKPPLAGILSFRMGLHFRVLFLFESSSEIKLLNIKNRKDIYRIKK